MVRLCLFICLRATEAALPGGFSIRRRLQTYTPAKAGGFLVTKPGQCMHCPGLFKN